ncbi:sporulation protein YtxC [Paraclostridium bifermentans]|uniref:Sporulation protein YtxC n=1 Tax=Paraclostridium bifermentans TaxID=1490 RepID=A0ABY8R3A0_PARBF|nr:sporulation protein YtxC [Paraclostridium bifermentans]
MDNKEIYLSLLPKYELAVNQFVKQTKFSNIINYNDDVIEIKISTKDRTDETVLEISREITDILMQVIKEVILKEYIQKSYGDKYNQEIEKIYLKSLEVFKSKDLLLREIIFCRMNNYILNNDHIDVDGFVKFRMKELMGYIANICEDALEEYLIEKDYDEFISVLRYFINVQETKIDTLKVYIRKDNSFILYDKNNNIIENENDEELINMFIKENLNYEDFLISTLLSLSQII